MNVNLLTNILQRQRLLTDAIRFGLVGVIAAVVDIGLLNILYLGAGLGIYTATAWAFVIASIVAYRLNNHWTYRRLGLPFRAQNLTKYTATGAVGLVITEGIIHLLVGRQGLDYNLAKIIAIMLVFFWNFFVNRYWTFRVRKLTIKTGEQFPAEKGGDDNGGQ